MAERLKALMLLAALPLAAWPAAHAQPALSDPTRPPNVLPGAPSDANQPDKAPARASRLQSVLISPHRRLAVIDGRTVPLGGKVDDATLVQIAETHVTLKRGDELRMLELYPGVERKAVRQGEGAEKKKGNHR
jgi:MSHA biogenesis protein MshK